MIKLIVSDVDGTLMNDNYMVSELNIRALSECSARGIGVILATGKLLYSLLPIVEKLNLEMPQITGGGATVIDTKKEVSHSWNIDPSVYKEIIELIRSQSCTPIVSLSDNTMRYEKLTPIVNYIEKIGEKIISANDLTDEIFSRNIIAISAWYEKGDLYKELVNVFNEDQIMITKPWKNYLSLYSPEVSKGKALIKIMKKFEIGKEEVAVFGDNRNDISMFEIAGLKIAVGNACPQILSMADSIAPDNNDSGVGKAIYEHILNISKDAVFKREEN